MPLPGLVALHLGRCFVTWTRLVSGGDVLLTDLTDRHGGRGDSSLGAFGARGVFQLALNCSLGGKGGLWALVANRVYKHSLTKHV